MECKLWELETPAPTGNAWLIMEGWGAIILRNTQITSWNIIIQSSEEDSHTLKSIFFPYSIPAKQRAHNRRKQVSWIQSEMLLGSCVSSSKWALKWGLLGGSRPWGHPRCASWVWMQWDKLSHTLVTMPSTPWQNCKPKRARVLLGCFSSDVQLWQWESN